MLTASHSNKKVDTKPWEIPNHKRSVLFFTLLQELGWRAQGIIQGLRKDGGFTANGWVDVFLPTENQTKSIDFYYPMKTVFYQSKTLKNMEVGSINGATTTRKQACWYSSENRTSSLKIQLLQSLFHHQLTQDHTSIVPTYSWKSSVMQSQPTTMTRSQPKCCGNCNLFQHHPAPLALSSFPRRLS